MTSSAYDYQFFTYTASKTCTHRIDVTGTSARLKVYMMERVSNGYQEFNNWIGIYSGNNIKITTSFTSGKTYIIAIYSDTSKTVSGSFKMKHTTKEVKSASIYIVNNKFLNVGPTGKGKWAVNDDGSKNFDVWLFEGNEILTLYEMQITYSDNSTYRWKGTSGPEVGNTGLIVVPDQLTDNWKLDQTAYCNLYVGDKVSTSKLKIAYRDPLFKDVRDPSNPYYKAIYWAAGKGITKGYSDGTFGINKSCTRGEAVMFIWRMAGKPAPKSASKSPFKDVPTSHTFYKAILWASQKGVTTGYSDKTFRPGNTCTRGQIMTFIWRYKGKPAPKAVSKSPFSDVPKTHTYYKAILWGSQKGVTKGMGDGTFGINTNCSRGQIVTFLYRIK